MNKIKTLLTLITPSLLLLTIIIIVSDIFYRQELAREESFKYWQEMLSFRELDYEDKILDQTYYSNLSEPSEEQPKGYNYKKIAINVGLGIGICIGTYLIYKTGSNCLKDAIADAARNSEPIPVKEFTIEKYTLFARGLITQTLIYVGEVSPFGDIIKTEKMIVVVPTQYVCSFEHNFAYSLSKLFDNETLLKLTTIDVLKIIDNENAFKMYLHLWESCIKK